METVTEAAAWIFCYSLRGGENARCFLFGKAGQEESPDKKSPPDNKVEELWSSQRIKRYQPPHRVRFPSFVPSGRNCAFGAAGGEEVFSQESYFILFMEQIRHANFHNAAWKICDIL